MLTVAEGGVLGASIIDAQPAMTINVMQAKAELMKLVFMGFWISDLGFYRVGFSQLSHEFVRRTESCL